MTPLERPWAANFRTLIHLRNPRTRRSAQMSQVFPTVLLYQLTSSIRWVYLTLCRAQGNHSFLQGLFPGWTTKLSLIRKAFREKILCYVVFKRPCISTGTKNVSLVAKRYWLQCGYKALGFLRLSCTKHYRTSPGGSCRLALGPLSFLLADPSPFPSGHPHTLSFLCYPTLSDHIYKHLLLVSVQSSSTLLPSLLLSINEDKVF